MYNFLSTLILPLPFLFLLFLLGIVGYFLKRRRVTRIFGISAIIWMGLISTGFLPNFLVRSLEYRYFPLRSVKKLDTISPVYIMVLGAGHTDDKSLPPNSQLSGIVLGRLIEGIRLYHELPHCKIIFSGDKGEQTESQAVILSQTSSFLGVSADDIKMFTSTINTEDEAKTFMQTFGNKNIVYLVTDAIHMPRAIYYFKHEGVNAIAAPTNYLYKKGSVYRPLAFLIPRSDNINRMEAAIHEYAGLLWIKLNFYLQKLL